MKSHVFSSRIKTRHAYDFPLYLPHEFFTNFINICIKSSINFAIICLRSHSFRVSFIPGSLISMVPRLILIRHF